MDFIALNIDNYVDSILLFLGNYGFIIVIVFGIAHPIFENPLSLFTLTLSITLLGVGYGYLLLALSNLIGIIILFYLAEKFNKSTNGFLAKRKTSDKMLNWIKNAPTWRHVFVIGVPFIPTYPIKLAVPLSGVGFKKYMVTISGAYLFLFFGNSLIYFGVLGFISSVIPSYISISLLVIFVLFVYFGIDFFKNNIEKDNKYTE